MRSGARPGQRSRQSFLRRKPDPIAAPAHLKEHAVEVTARIVARLHSTLDTIRPDYLEGPLPHEKSADKRKSSSPEPEKQIQSDSQGHRSRSPSEDSPDKAGCGCNGTVHRLPALLNVARYRGRH